MLYLLQLVQALKFEYFDSKDPDPNSSSLAQFLIDRAISNPVLGTYLHWYLMIEIEDKIYGTLYAKVAFHYFQDLLQVKGVSYGVDSFMNIQ